MRIENDLVSHGFVIDAADALENVAEGAVSQVVKKCAGEADGDIAIFEGKRLAELKEHPPGGFHDTQAVAVTGMIGAGVGERRHAELADSAEALEFGGVGEGEEEALGRPFHAEGNDIMHGIADDFFGHGLILFHPAAMRRLTEVCAAGLAPLFSAAV
jgi:hypothetical protein